MITYSNSFDELTEDMLEGFFVDWVNPPTNQIHMKILKGSYCFWVAIDKDKNKVIGFITAISDGVISAYIPLLEVLPEYQNNGIGKELVSRMLTTLNHFYMIDLLCDQKLQAYYCKFGMINATGVLIRNHERQSCE